MDAYPYAAPTGERIEELVMSDEAEITVEALSDGRIRLSVVNLSIGSKGLEGCAILTLTHSQAREVYYMLHRITGGDYADGL